MPEYINKQQILEKAREHQNNPFGISVLIAEIEKSKGIDIVFCKECEYWWFREKRCSNAEYTCCDDSIATSPTHFCGYGERREI